MISAILLAAGQSKRMNGENKLTKEINGIPIIKCSAKNILGSAIDELIIVLGHEMEIIKNIIEKNKKIKFIYNEDFKSGMASSIRIGLKNDGTNVIMGRMDDIRIYDVALSDKEVKMLFYNSDIYRKVTTD